MSDKKPSLSLEPVGREFKLTRIDGHGKRSEMSLSSDNIMTLAQSAQRLRDRILSSNTRSGVTAVAPTIVAQVELNDALLHSEILLTMIDRHGARACFALPVEIAELLVEKLPPRIDGIRGEKPKH
jgi:hypothetical protein